MPETTYKLTYLDLDENQTNVSFLVPEGASIQMVADRAYAAVSSLERMVGEDVSIGDLKIFKLEREDGAAVYEYGKVSLSDIRETIKRLPGPSSLESYSQTELLKRAAASEALGADPSDADLSAYNALMGEIERRCMSIETPLGTLRAQPVGRYGNEYRGIQVTLEKPDGTSGLVSWTEVASDSLEYEPEERLHTFAYDLLDKVGRWDETGRMLTDEEMGHAPKSVLPDPRQYGAARAAASADMRTDDKPIRIKQ